MDEDVDENQTHSEADSNAEPEDDGSDFDDDSQSNFGAYLNVDLESNADADLEVESDLKDVQEENDGSKVTSRKFLTPDKLGVCDENCQWGCHPGKGKHELDLGSGMDKISSAKNVIKHDVNDHMRKDHGRKHMVKQIAPSGSKLNGMSKDKITSKSSTCSKCDSVSIGEKEVKVNSRDVHGGKPRSFYGGKMVGGSFDVQQKEVSKNVNPSERLYAMKAKVLDKLKRLRTLVYDRNANNILTRKFFDEYVDEVWKFVYKFEDKNLPWGIKLTDKQVEYWEDKIHKTFNDVKENFIDVEYMVLIGPDGVGYENPNYKGPKSSLDFDTVGQKLPNQRSI